MDKTTLRNKLFDKYFELEDGVLAVDLVDKLSFIMELWKKLHILCENNIKHFSPFSAIDKFKAIEYKQKKYLILKETILGYVIVDIEKMESITKKQFITEFDEDFFVKNFDEDDRATLDLYSIDTYKNVQELVDFYIQNQSLLSLSTGLYYKLEIDEAWTYFYIDFANAKAKMVFETPNKLLDEQLFLNYDLTASNMQDAQKIGFERMKEMFEKIKELKIPKEIIPNDLYQQFLSQCDTKRKTKVK